MSETDLVLFQAIAEERDLAPRFGLLAHGPMLSAPGKFDPLPGWAALARQAAYQPSRFAALVGASLRTLQRFMQTQTYGQGTLAQWLNSIRQRDALASLLSGKSVKETAIEMAYKRVSHFCREFKRFHDVSPGLIGRQQKRDMSSSSSLSSPLARFDNRLARFDN